MFFDDFSFTKLVQPTTKASFFDDFFGKKTLLIKRNNPNFYEGLLSPKQLDEVLFHWPNDATIVKANEQDGNRQNMHASVTQNNTPTVLKALDEGSTLILDKLDHRIASLTQLNAILERETHYSFQSNIYITPPKSQGFRAHFDDHHVFILQTTGSKLWRVDNTAKPHSTASEKALDYTIDANNHQEFLLEQGDLIYIPPYTVHEAEGQSEYSVHITLSPYPPSWQTLVAAVLNEQSLGDSVLNQPLPAAYLDSDPALITAQLKKVLENVIDNLSDRQSEKFIKDQANDFRAVFAGALEYRMNAPTIGSDSRYCLNHSVLMRTKESSDELIIQTPKKDVALPIMFAEQIQFCLSGPAFCASEVPDMSAEESQVLLGRLLTEGLITELS